MTAPSSPLIYVDLYQQDASATALARAVLKRTRPQRWRWRAINGDNGRVLAISSEAYTNEADAEHAIDTLFGAFSDVYLRRDGQGNELLRLSENHTN
ncbi:DUF1508 domain-containing protein [Mycobacterium intracellulare]|uniref:DUF1508 domain-containing protein n=1 Tax=Mycobacterium intracellulare TaxID=1767 RepID=UPI00080BF2F4|nr:DUF1508 domain-containing protein [Mycobacterium intracellulare]OCB15114.1 hypothetical protein A5689_27050 [Mycobacterium intracellulare subsp. yongonense]